MRKEIMWVAGIGIIVGLIFAFGVYRVNSLFPKKTDQTEPTPNPQTQNSEFTITLNKPENKDVVTSDSTIVNGLTKPDTFVTVSGEDGDYITQSDSTGVFEQEIELISGINQIKVTAFDRDGSHSVTQVLVVYSSTFQEKELPTSQNVSTGESEIRIKVQEKIADALSHPKAYLGTVTDIADSTIQIKSAESQIEQISVKAEDIVVVNATGLTNKTVKLTDVAIGDFIVAMGYVNANAVLDAQRILITKPLADSKVTTYMGKVFETTNKGFSVRIVNPSEEVTVTPDRNTDYFSFLENKLTAIKFGSISEEDTVLYILDSSATTPLVRSVFKI